MRSSCREQVFDIVHRRGLCSYRNDTKWRDLREAVLRDMPFPPPHILKTLFEDSCPAEPALRQDVHYWGGWQSAFPARESASGCCAVEWVKVRPRYQ